MDDSTFLCKLYAVSVSNSMSLACIIALKYLNSIFYHARIITRGTLLPLEWIYILLKGVNDFQYAKFDNCALANRDTVVP